MTFLRSAQPQPIALPLVQPSAAMFDDDGNHSDRMQYWEVMSHLGKNVSDWTLMGQIWDFSGRILKKIRMVSFDQGW